MTGGIAHSSYGGIGLAIYLGIPVLFGATVFAVITAILIAIITLKNRTRIDAIIGMMWASGMAIGIIFVDLTPGYNVDLMSYLFGSIITITTEQVAEYVAERLLLDTAMVKKTVNVNMARLEKEGQIMRLTKGIYCRRVKTAFGYYTPDKETLFCKQLLRKENEIIGYETGLSALNRIGLVSQMPKRRCIATNLHTKRIPEGMQIEIRKPPIVVNSGNFRYLQILDAIRELDMAPVDTAKPIDVVRATVEEFTLKTEMLILMARKYYGQKTLLRTIDILLEGSYETARG